MHVQGGQRRAFTCDECNQLFGQKSRRDDHVSEVHRNEKRHHCDCGESFFTTDEFSKHKRLGGENCTEIKRRGGVTEQEETEQDVEEEGEVKEKERESGSEDE